MTATSTIRPWRQHVMRVLFFLNFISLAPDNWSIIFLGQEKLEPMTGVAISFYAALSLLCILGMRFPLRFTSLLLLQLFYKIAWLIGVYLPAYNLNSINENLESWFWVMAPGILIDLLVIPWDYVYQQYLSGFFVLEK